MCNNKCIAKPATNKPSWLTMALTQPQAELIDAMCRQEILDDPEGCEHNPHFKALFRRISILLADFDRPFDPPLTVLRE